jgi:hypothetical protein
MLQKFEFYQRYGVEEYYLHDPDGGTLEGWLRKGERLQEIEKMEGWVSPRLKVRFELVNGELQLFGPDGQRFATYVEMATQRDEARQRAERLAAKLRALGIDPEV